MPDTDQPTQSKREEIVSKVLEDWRRIGVTVHEGVYLPSRTMVVSADLMEHFKRLKAAELEKAS